MQVSENFELINCLFCQVGWGMGEGNKTNKKLID